MISRRQFLKAFVGIGASLALPVAALAFDTANVHAVPPSVMLHSRHWRAFPDLLAKLRDLGYSGITYRDWEQSLLGNTTLPDQPVILSIDDLSMEKGNPAFRYFKRMKNNCLDAGFNVVFGIVTRPNLPQDPDRWAEVASWVGDGMELATHTAYHSNLDNPRFITDDYHTEIVDSAAMIEVQTGQTVRTLVTPYGSGYDVKTQTLNSNVLSACREAELGFIVGISTGQRHVHLDTRAGDIIYAGRANPSDQYMVNDALYYIKYW